MWSDFEILFKIKSVVTPVANNSTSGAAVRITAAAANSSAGEMMSVATPSKPLKTIRQGEIIGTRLVQEQVSHVQAVSTVQVTEREAVTQDKLMSVIKDMLEKIKDQQLFYAAINNAVITLDEELINIGVISKADLQTLSPTFKEWLKAGLRAGLHNSYLEINYFKQELSDDIKVQTESELLKDLLNESSLFKKLFEALELELDM